MRTKEVMALLAATVPHVAMPASQVAADCPVVTVAEMLTLLRLAQHGGLAIRGGDVCLDYGVLPEAR
jgi:hypothetical protein